MQSFKVFENSLNLVLRTLPAIETVVHWWRR